jgi:hypothetical protein
MKVVAFTMQKNKDAMEKQKIAQTTRHGGNFVLRLETNKRRYLGLTAPAATPAGSAQRATGNERVTTPSSWRSTE